MPRFTARAVLGLLACTAALVNADDGFYLTTGDRADPTQHVCQDDQGFGRLAILSDPSKLSAAQNFVGSESLAAAHFGAFECATAKKFNLESASSCTPSAVRAYPVEYFSGIYWGDGTLVNEAQYTSFAPGLNQAATNPFNPNAQKNLIVTPTGTNWGQLTYHGLCEACPSDRTCDGKTSQGCAAGYYTTDGAQTCEACEKGYHCAGGFENRQVCLEGEFCPAMATTPASCASAEMHMYCPAGDTVEAQTLNSTAGIPCPQGFYCKDGQKASCSGQASVHYYCPAGDDAAADFKFDSTAGIPCPQGFYCAGDNEDKASCHPDAKEGYYCPAGENGAALGLLSTAGIPCTAGSYCPGGEEDIRACTCGVGFYCPPVWRPFTSEEIEVSNNDVRRDSVSIAPETVGRACPPVNQYCAGSMAQPVDLPQLCDLVQSCGPLLQANDTCAVKQSTFFKYNDPAAHVAVDGDDSTCMKTATADTDANPQWLRVDLGEERLVGTVRFSSPGAASDFDVLVTAEDADPVDVHANGNEKMNPSQGGTLPALREACTVAGAGSGVFEASCGAATKGMFVFIRRATAGSILEVCELEVYAHTCVAEEEVSCPIGYAPSACTDEDSLCRGCEPCPSGTYSDKVGPYACTPCPGYALYGEVPYSPEGSTSVFQCEGDAHLDGTSTLEVVDGGVTFNTSSDAWEIEIEYELAPRIQINGLSTIFMSKGGDAAVANAGTFQSKNFPCRADFSIAAGSDLSASLEETVCCLQDMRQDYLMTKIFRDYTNGLDLVAANDVCDGDGSVVDGKQTGSNMLVNADLEVVGEGAGTIMVDTDGNGFANAITVTPLGGDPGDGTYAGKQRAKITIPDAELYKVSKSLNPDGNLTDSRELFIGLLDLLPTGTRVVDSASQQISIVLTRTQYGTFAAYGEQNIDYDFISFLNARAHKVINQGGDDEGGTTGNCGCVGEAAPAFFQLQNDLYSQGLISDAEAEVFYARSDVQELLACLLPCCDTEACSTPGSPGQCPEGCRREDSRRALRSTTRRSGSRRDEYYAEVTFVYDDRLQPVNATGAVVLDTVTVTIDKSDTTPCRSSSLDSDFEAVIGQSCGPKDLPWEEVCPQVSTPDDHFGRLYIPLPDDLDTDVIHIEFDLWFTDAGGRSDKIALAMDLVVKDFVTHCDSESGSVDLAQLVTPRIIVGTEADAPARLTGWSDMDDSLPFATGAETLQDGMVTLILDLDDSKVGLEENVNSLDNLEVFFEDVLVIHVNPGSQPDINEIKDSVTDGNSKYAPTHNYNPDSRDAWLNIPLALKTDCPAEDATTSFFGCVHKHILRNKVITNETDAYFVGSSPPPAAGAQDFVETMLGDGTASVAARELGRDFEQYLMTTEGVTGSSPTSIGLWINPGHKWGGVTANSEYSLSNHLIIHVLFGVRSGIDGSERRMLLSTNGDGTTSMVRTLEYNVNAATLIESVMDDVVAIEVEAQLALSAEEACMPPANLRGICSERLRAAVEPHASKVERVECVSVQVENANCDGTRRADAAPVALVDAVIALAKSESAFLDMDAVVASGSVLAMKKTAGRTFPSAEGETPTPEDKVEGGEKASDKDSGSGSGSGSNTVVIGAAVGAAVGVVLVAFGAWKASKKCNAPTEPLTEVVSTGVVEPVSEKARIENLLFENQRQ